MTGEPTGPRSVVALCGGIGGAKLALGLERVIGADLTVVVNTGDDFEHLGLTISPDIDTVLYTLGGRSDTVRGWGRAEESWAFMGALAEVGGETWFQLGDRDLALHVERTARLRDGTTPTAFTSGIAKRFGISATILPMSDDLVRTTVLTEGGSLPFQRYFVEKRCEPALTAVIFEGVQAARPTAEVRRALSALDLRAIVICPSNPYLSVDPILAVPGMRDALQAAGAPIVAVSPIIGGQAVKGPTAKIMAELGVPATQAAVAAHYRGLIDGLVIDPKDADAAPSLGIASVAVPTLMNDLADRERLARDVLRFADEIRASGGGRP